MGRPYQSEIDALQHTYVEAMEADVSLLVDFVGATSGRGLLAIGSGGSLVSASLMAELHESTFHTVSRALTPLEFSEREGLWSRSGIALVSARGANRDILAAAKRSLLAEPRTLVAICNATRSRLSKILGSQRVLDVPPSFGKDGFLATNSLMASSIAILRAYIATVDSPPLPQSLADILGCTVTAYQRKLASDLEAILVRPTTHIIYSGAGRLAAIDLESRLSEAALANSTISDIRNFGHGRHLWLARRPTDSSVLFLYSPATASLVRRTRRLLPQNIPSTSIELNFDDGRGALQGIVASMLIAGAYASSQGVDPGKPNVPEFGRALFSVPIDTRRGDPAKPKSRPSQRKLDAAFATKDQEVFFEIRQRAFLRRLEAASFQALVMDYDGTCIDSRDRFKVPDKTLRDALSPLLEAHVLLCLATGRGDSIMPSLEALIAQRYSNFVVLALHNGALLTDLAGKVLATHEPDDGQVRALSSFAAAFQASGLDRFATIRSHRCQHSIIPKAQGQGRWLVRAVTELCEGADFRLSVKASGHSIDMVPRGVDKALIMKYLKDDRGIESQAALCIGDQGAFPGNDFHLLNAPYGLSVDRVSASAETCWNLSDAGIVGPQATIAYLEMLEPQAGGKFRFRGQSNQAM